MTIKSEITRHRELYYAGTPEITDAEYDVLEAQLREEDPDSPLLGKVGAEVFGSFDKVTHSEKMLSLGKAYETSELADWLPTSQGIVCMPKIDGFAISLSYKLTGSEYLLDLAATRGNGKVGEDITKNVLAIEAIPSSISAALIPEGVTTFEVRGECYMKKSVFSRLGLDKEYENCRNLAPGSVRQKNPAVTKARQLDFFAYNLKGLYLDSMSDKLNRLDHVGFTSVPHEYIPGNHVALDHVSMLYNTHANGRDDLDYFIDGVVYMVDDLNEFASMGETSHHPKGAIAWKFEAEKAESVLESVQWQVSRTGMINPVGIYESVNLDGANLTNATLHNLSQIKKLGLGIGDKILISRQGGVIPKILEVLESAGNGLDIPSRCPECSGAVEVRNEKGTDTLHCLNPACPAVALTQIVHLIKVLEIDGVAESMVQKLMDAGMVSKPVDLYRVNGEQLTQLPGVKEKSALNYLKAVDKSRKQPLSAFLTSLGIHLLGKKMGSVLAEEYKNLDAVLAATQADIESLPEAGPKIAESCANGLAAMKAQVAELRSEITLEAPVEASGQSLLGSTFLVTGTLSKPRKQIEAFIKDNGGKMVSSVSKNLSYLVAGEKAGSKLVKAEKAGVTVITEQELEGMT